MAAAEPVEAREPLPCLPGWVDLKLGNLDVEVAPVGEVLLLATFHGVTETGTVPVGIADYGATVVETGCRCPASTQGALVVPSSAAN